MKKSCLVVGYMNNNLGDDLFFKILFDRYPNIDFYFYPPSLLLDRYKKIFKNNKNVIFYDNEEQYQIELDYIKGKDIPINLFPMICERAKTVDFYINIGGSIFIQNDNWEEDDRFKIKEIIGKKPSFIIGCNYGPGDDEYYKYLKKWFKNFEDICFRDNESYELFKDLNNVRKADDIVLINQEKSNSKKYGIAISVIDLDTKKELKTKKEAYYNYLRAAIKLFLSKNISVTLFSFCDEDGDLKAIKEIVSGLTKKEREEVVIVSYKDNIDNFLKIWKRHEYVIATRFHAMILALKYNQKVLSLVYSNKTSNYLNNINEKISKVFIKNINKYNTDKFIFSKINKEFDSEEQFKIIDKWMG